MRIVHSLLAAIPCLFFGSVVMADSFAEPDDSIYVAAFQQMSSTESVRQINLSDALCCEECAHWADGLELFAGLEGAKQPQDFGVNAQMGGRVHANYGKLFNEDLGLGFQLGTALYNGSHAVRVTSQLEGSSGQTQSLTTFGLFQKSQTGWAWGLVYDYLYEDDYDQFALTQMRGRVSYLLAPDREIGMTGMLPLTNSNETWGAVPVLLEPLAQGNVYFRKTWDNQAETTCWLGMSESHSRANVALGDASPTGNVLLYGADFHVPLSNHVALYGEANMITPADTGTVDAYLGFAFYPSGNAYGWRKQRYSPVLPVASHSSFAIDLRR